MFSTAIPAGSLVHCTQAHSKMSTGPSLRTSDTVKMPSQLNTRDVTLFQNWGFDYLK